MARFFLLHPQKAEMGAAGSGAASRTDLDYYPNPMTNRAHVPQVPQRMLGAGAVVNSWQRQREMLARRYLDHGPSWSWMQRPIIEKTNAGAMYHHTSVPGSAKPRTGGVVNESTR